MSTSLSVLGREWTVHESVSLDYGINAITITVRNWNGIYAEAQLNKSAARELARMLLELSDELEGK